MTICFMVFLFLTGCCNQTSKGKNVTSVGVSQECRIVFDEIQNNWKPIRDFKPEETPWYTTSQDVISQLKQRKFDACLFTLDKSGLIKILGNPTYDRETPKSYPSPPDLGYECKVDGSDGYVIWFHLDKKTGLVRFIDPSKVQSFH